MLSGPSILELLAEHREHAPNQVPFTFHAAGQPEKSTTYRELMGRAAEIAAALKAQASPSPNVVLLYAPGLEFICALLGCFYAGAVAVPTYPPLSRRMAERFQVIVKDAGASIVLTTRDLYQMVIGLSDESAGLEGLPVVFTDELDGGSTDWTAPDVTEAQPAFVQYTSGSTADPKGILVTHGNLVSNCRAIKEKMMRADDTAVVSWLPMYHDMGLIGAILQPLASGVPVHLMSPLDFLHDPLSWLRLISETRATSSGGPNFAFDLCTRRFDDKKLAGVDLSSWSIAWVGAERVRHDTLERFQAAYSHLGFDRNAFYACYGLAETTLFATGGERGTPPDVLFVQKDALRTHVVAPAGPDQDGNTAVVSCGRPASSHQVLVQTPDAKIAGEDIVGEVLFAGPSLAAGYWRRGRSESLDPDTAMVGGQTFFRTGDLGFIHNDSLYVTGRSKDLIIVRGQNFYPEDVETIAQDTHESLRPGCGAAFSLEGSTSEIAILVQEVGTPESEFVPAPVAERIRQTVAAAIGLHLHGIAFIPPRTIPKTSSGKVKRAECRRLYAENRLKLYWSDLLPEPGSAPETTDERLESALSQATLSRHQGAIRDIWQRVLGVAKVDDHDDFFDLGGTSIGAARMLSLLESELGLLVPFSALVGNSSLSVFAHQVELVEGDADMSAVSFNLGGSNWPLHCMLSWPGMFTAFRSLAERLGDEQPVHSILPMNELEGYLPLLAIEEMAKRAATEVLRLQPEGTYFLCGYSMGGLIAYETARQLSASGKTVGRLIILDSALPGPGYFVSRAAGMSPRQLGAAIMRRVRTNILARDLEKRAVSASDDSISVVANNRNWDLMNFRAWKRYRAESWDGPVTILRAAVRSVDIVQTWRNVLGSPPEVIDVPGDHFTMFEEGHIGEIVTALQAAVGAFPPPDLDGVGGSSRRSLPSGAGSGG